MRGLNPLFPRNLYIFPSPLFLTTASPLRSMKRLSFSWRTNPKAEMFWLTGMMASIYHQIRWEGQQKYGHALLCAVQLYIRLSVSSVERHREQHRSIHTRTHLIWEKKLVENVGVEQQSVKFLLNPVWISGADQLVTLQLKDDLKNTNTLAPFIRGLPQIHIWSTFTKPSWRHRSNSQNWPLKQSVKPYQENKLEAKSIYRTNFQFSECSSIISNLLLHQWKSRILCLFVSLLPFFLLFIWIHAKSNISTILLSITILNYSRHLCLPDRSFLKQLTCRLHKSSKTRQDFKNFPNQPGKYCFTITVCIS